MASGFYDRKEVRMIALFLAKCTKNTEHEVAKLLAEYGFKESFKRTASLCHSESGKPYFYGERKAFVSISHSEGLCLAAISDSEIGVDIEYMKQGDERLLRLAQRYFTPGEVQYIEKEPYPRFYKVWCMKESYIKYTGEGFTCPLGSFSVLDPQKAPIGIIFTDFTYGNYKIAVCSEENATFEPTYVDDFLITQ